MICFPFYLADRVRAYWPVIRFGRCVYCGDPASCRDHYRAWSATWDPHWLPACPSCNGILSNSAQETLGARADHVRRSLERRHRRTLETDWAARLADPEIGPGLRAILESAQAGALLAARCLAWADTIATAFARLRLEDVAEAGAELRIFLESLV